MTSAAASIEPIKVLKLVPTLLCGGTENQFMTLSRSLNGERFRIDLACLRRVGPFVDDATRDGMALHEYPIGSFRRGRALAQQARFASDVARRRFDIVHAYSFYGNVFAVPPARLVGTPVVIASIRDRGPYLTSMQMRVQRHVCRWATRILVNAQAVKDWLLDQGYERSRIVVIPNGVDMARFKDAVDGEAVRLELGVPSGAELVTVVSRLNQLKGLEEFLEAAGLLALHFPRAYFLIVGESRLGDTEYKATLTALAQRLGIADRVRFTGIRTDVPALLASTTVSVMPSLNEALSNVLLESMAAGAATVATRVGGTPEAMVDGVTGLLVPPGDARALAGAIAHLLENPPLAAALGRAARQTIEERFTVGRMARATEQLYVELLAEKRGDKVEALWSIKTSSRQAR